MAARHDLAFAFSLPPFLFLFCLFSCSLTQARQYFFFFQYLAETWQAVHLIRAWSMRPHIPRMQSVSCYCTQSHILFRNCSNTSQTSYFESCKNVPTAGPARKCWDVKGVDKGRMCYTWQCIIPVDGTAVTVILLYDEHCRRWQEILPWIWFASLHKISTLQVCVASFLPKCQNWMRASAMLLHTGHCSHPGRPKNRSALPVVQSSKAIITEVSFFFLLL